MKKLIIALSLFVFAQNALAMSLHEDTFKLERYYSLSHGEHRTSPLCPVNAVCITDGTLVEIEYVVSCHEELVNFESKAIEADGKIQLFVNAVVKANPGAIVCAGFYPVTKKVSLPMMFGEVVVHSLGGQEYFTQEQ